MRRAPQVIEQLTISVPEAGALLGLSRPAAYRAAARGEIPTLAFGRNLRVPRRAFFTMLNDAGRRSRA